MKGRKGFTLIELLVVIAIIAILAAILFPVFARARAAAQKSNCESNMNQIGKAMKMYLQDWHDTYPTNRAGGALNYTVALTEAGVINNASGKQAIGAGGLAWVELLYDYMEPPSPESNGAWECKTAAARKWPNNNAFAYTTYALNYYLLEQPEGVIKQSDKLMLCREMEGHWGSVCRPTITPANQAAGVPANAFPCGYDGLSGGLVNHKLHGMGSHILFTDSHVALFPTTAFVQPAGGPPNPPAHWDANDGQWFNMISGPSRKKVALSP